MLLMDKGTALSYKRQTCYDSIYITEMSIWFLNLGGQAAILWAQFASPPVGIGLTETPNSWWGLSPPGPPANNITDLY